VGEALCIFTIGHSTHGLEAFAEILREHGVACLADVRRFPGSRRMPHFSAESLAAELPHRGVRYLPLKDLGGRRDARPDSPNAGWRVAGFRGYADYMASPEFERALGRLEAEAAACRTAIMCAEGLWWRCHRRLIADVALLARDVPVRHLMHDGRLTDHHPTDGVRRRDDGLLVYDAGQEPLPGA
jgi:uncharacterized protein (DUF488 family)